MKVEIEHVFEGIQPAAYEALYFDEAFNEALGAHLHMGRKLLRLDRTPDRIVRHVRYEPSQDPDGAAKQAFGTSRASFLEELEYDRRVRRGLWRTIPNLFAERVKTAGTLEFVTGPLGTKRLVTGEVAVKLFGFGGRVEKMIAAEIVKSYQSSTEFTRAWLARR
ncbi:hypothetical protein BH11MYX1_BH11MYX1_03810 [soil metagenome]